MRPTAATPTRDDPQSTQLQISARTGPRSAHEALLRRVETEPAPHSILATRRCWSLTRARRSSPLRASATRGCDFSRGNGARDARPGLVRRSRAPRLPGPLGPEDQSDGIEFEGAILAEIAPRRLFGDPDVARRSPTARQSLQIADQ